MSVGWLEIQGLRGFAGQQRLDLAVPNGMHGGGLTVLVGPNSGGKSTVVEAFGHLSAVRPPAFPPGERNEKAGGRICLKAGLVEGGWRGLNTVEAGGSETEWISEELQSPFTIFVVSSRRAFPAFFASPEFSDRYHYSNQYQNVRRPKTQDQFYRRLGGLQRDPARRKMFDAMIRKVTPNFPDWTIELSDQGQNFVRVATGTGYHNSDGLGDGLVSLLMVLDALYDSEENNLIVIDEPELSLYPALLKRLGQLIGELTVDRQIVLATHSPYRSSGFRVGPCRALHSGTGWRGGSCHGSDSHELGT